MPSSFEKGPRGDFSPADIARLKRGDINVRVGVGKGDPRTEWGVVDIVGNYVYLADTATLIHLGADKAALKQRIEGKSILHDGDVGTEDSVGYRVGYRAKMSSGTVKQALRTALREARQRDSAPGPFHDDVADVQREPVAPTPQPWHGRPGEKLNPAQTDTFAARELAQQLASQEEAEASAKRAQDQLELARLIQHQADEAAGRLEVPRQIAGAPVSDGATPRTTHTPKHPPRPGEIGSGEAMRGIEHQPLGKAKPRGDRSDWVNDWAEGLNDPDGRNIYQRGYDASAGGFPGKEEPNAGDSAVRQPELSTEERPTERRDWTVDVSSRIPNSDERWTGEVAEQFPPSPRPEPAFGKYRGDLGPIWDDDDLEATDPHITSAATRQPVAPPIPGFGEEPTRLHQPLHDSRPGWEGDVDLNAPTQPTPARAPRLAPPPPPASGRPPLQPFAPLSGQRADQPLGQPAARQFDPAAGLRDTPKFPQIEPQQPAQTGKKKVKKRKRGGFASALRSIFTNE